MKIATRAQRHQGTQIERSLNELRSTWEQKRILREIYTGWYHDITQDLQPGTGKTLEIGSGIGNFKQYMPGVLSSDIQEAQWLDLRFDAHFLPFAAGSIQNIVMVDVLHHLARPLHFIQEAERVLCRGGRLIMLEPYPSLVSLIIYKFFHPEPFLMKANYFEDRREMLPGYPGKLKSQEPNQAAAYLIFYKQKKQFEKLFAQRMTIIKKKLFACVLYPLSGGFQKKTFLPVFLVPLARCLEVLATPFRFILAFRCRIVLEKS
jgi:SAM-dependent methyltransferase